MTQIFKLNTENYDTEIARQKMSEGIINRIFEYLNEEDVNIKPTINFSLTVNEHYYVLDKKMVNNPKFNSVDIELLHSSNSEEEDISEEEIYESIYQQLANLNTEILHLQKRVNDSIDRIDKMG